MKEITVLELRKNLAVVTGPLVRQEQAVCLVKMHGQPSFGLTTLPWAHVIADVEASDQAGAILPSKEVQDIFFRIVEAMGESEPGLSVEQLVAEFVRQAKIVSNYRRVQKLLAK